MENLMQVRVAAKTLVAEGVATFDLVPVEGESLPPFDAGAHIDVHVPDGPVRQYSLYELPGEPRRYRIGVLRDPRSRGGSARLLDRVREGDVLAVSAPRNHFALAAGAQHSLLFAGGIGITPILCMAQQLARERRSFDLHYCGRSLQRMAFVGNLRDASYAPNVHVHVDDGDPHQQLDARAAIGSPAAGKHVYVCGPSGFMDHILATARALGWDEAHLHREYFAAAPVDHAGDGPFELELRKTGRVIRVAADQSAAEALVDAGVPLSLSCEQGVCGTCITRVLEGAPDHRDMYLNEAERARNDCFMPCCSRASTPRLVLDL
jgi:vanillate O-demethylase ferredoxin subunit